MFWLAVHAYADCQFDSSFGCSAEEGEQAMAGWVSGSVGVLVEVSYFLLVYRDGQD